jgi:hypothetical protein
MASLASLLLIFGCIFSGYGLVGQLCFYTGLAYFVYGILLKIDRRSEVVLFIAIVALSILSGSGIEGESGNLKYFFRYQLMNTVIVFLLVFLRKGIDFDIKLIPIIGFIQSLVLISIAFYLAFFGSHELWLEVRSFVMAKGFGDIWTTDGFYYRVQLRGNHFVFIAWLLHFFFSNLRSFRDQLILLGLSLGVLVAGNASYIVCLIASIALSFLRNFKFKYFLVVLFCFLVLIFSGVFESFLDVLSRKFGGVDSSGGARIEQFLTFFNAVSLEGFYFYGAGAGAPYPIGHYGDGGWRTLTHYVELQSLFYIYKFGLFFGIFFLFFMLWPLFFYRDFKSKTLYFFYVMGSILNPYIYDANHILTLLTLMSIHSVKNYRSKSSGVT